MSVTLLYRRPAYVAPTIPRTPSMMSETTESVRSSKPPPPPTGVPEALSFDRIISNGTCPPCTLRDFMNYLLYIERSAENLQFFLWFRGYVQRFDALNDNEKSLSPQWTERNMKDALDEWKKSQANVQKRQPSIIATEVLNGTIFAKEAAVPGVGVGNPFATPPVTSHGRNSSQNTTDTRVSSSLGANRQGGAVSPWESAATVKSPTSVKQDSQRSKETAASIAHDAFENAGLSQPFTIQPFRKEIEHIIQTYFADGAPRELNISAGQRKTLLKALEATTHPSAFTRVVTDIEAVLRNQLHPNFIRWTICNGNRPRVIFARGLGISLILAGIIAELLITLSNVGRGWRALGAIGLVIGTATLIAAYKGMCVVLHGLHHRHLRPWELFMDAENDKGDSDSYNLRESVDTVQSTNSYEDAPWVVKYQKRNIIRKIFDREVWIQEPALRQIQDMIFIQSILCALLAAAIITAIFVAVPKGGFM